MARPKTKSELLDAVKENFDKLFKTIDSFSKEEFNEEFDFSSNPKLTEAHWARDKNIKDLLIHLYEWHQLLINWVDKNKSGESVSFLPEPYTFKTYGEMNVKFFKKHKKTSYKEAVNMLNNSHKKVIKLIESFSDEELFTKKYFSWTGTTNLGYCISSSSSHYDWAIKKLKKHRKILSDKKKSK